MYSYDGGVSLNDGEGRCTSRLLVCSVVGNAVIMFLNVIWSVIIQYPLLSGWLVDQVPICTVLIQ